jgi:hypothetical protein
VHGVVLSFISPPPSPPCLSTASGYAYEHRFPVCSGMVAINPETGEREHGTVTSEARRIFEDPDRRLGIELLHAGNTRRADCQGAASASSCIGHCPCRAERGTPSSIRTSSATRRTPPRLFRVSSKDACAAYAIGYNSPIRFIPRQ